MPAKLMTTADGEAITSDEAAPVRAQRRFSIGRQLRAVYRMDPRRFGTL
jgi:hypothetical protein